MESYVTKMEFKSIVKNIKLTYIPDVPLKNLTLSEILNMMESFNKIVNELCHSK